jgi:hypothetical protein
MTISRTVQPMHKAKLAGLIKANAWLFTQINKTIPKGLISLNELSTGTDGAQIFADQNVRIVSSEGTHEDLTLTTSIDIDLKRLHVSLYRQESMENFELAHMPELTQKVNRAFVDAGITSY